VCGLVSECCNISDLMMLLISFSFFLFVEPLLLINYRHIVIHSLVS